MKILVTKTHLSKMIEKAINEDCNYFTLLPINEKIHFAGTDCNFYEDIEFSDRKHVSVTSYLFDKKLMHNVLSLLLSLEEQPILLVFDRAPTNKLCIRLVSQVIDKTWRFL